MTKRTLFISDIHLDENQHKITQDFLQLLNFSQDASIDAIYILGDLFEKWIGDDHDTPLHRAVIKALSKTSQAGIAIYFIYGNRDFLIGKRFLQASGCQLLPDIKKILVYGTPTLIMHGDTLCTLDKHYLRLRKCMRNRLLQRLFLMLPLAAREAIARKMRKKSKVYQQSITQNIMDVAPDAVQHVMQSNRINYLIHGHTHRPGTHSIPLCKMDGTRIVLGSWHDEGHVLIWDESGQKRLLGITDALNALQL